MAILLNLVKSCQGEWLLKWQDQDIELMPQCQLEISHYQWQNDFCIELFVEMAVVLAYVDCNGWQHDLSKSQIQQYLIRLLYIDCVMTKSSMCPAMCVDPDICWQKSVV